MLSLFSESRRTLVVLAVDGVSRALAGSIWKPDLLGTLTSTFPSVSSTAWLTATTGLSPAQHGVIGVVFGDKAIDGVYHCYLDREFSHSTPPGAVEPCIAMGPWPTVFSTLRDAGASCIAHIGDLATVPGRWSRAVTHGAQIVEPRPRVDGVHRDPRATVALAVEQIEASLSQLSPGAPAVLWSYVNLDDHIHLNGYDDALCAALVDIERASSRWSTAGHVVLAHSDHGLVPTQTSQRCERLLQLINDPRLCRTPSGGAGRTLWAYPRPEHAERLREQVCDIAESFAHVLTLDALADYGLMEPTALVQSRIGSIVIIARDREFPLLDARYRFEHGSILPDEMLVPLALWRSH